MPADIHIVADDFDREDRVEHTRDPFRANPALSNPHLHGGVALWASIGSLLHQVEKPVSPIDIANLHTTAVALVRVVEILIRVVGIRVQNLEIALDHTVGCYRKPRGAR